MGCPFEFGASCASAASAVHDSCRRRSELGPMRTLRLCAAKVFL
jgi:hypothetical protein